MALSIDISTADLVRVENLLRSALAQHVPSGNFREGSFLNDVVVRAMAVIPAIVEQEARAVRARQSFRTVANLTAAEVDQAVDDLASNWFVSRKVGSYATGVATVHLSSSVGDILEIPATVTLDHPTGVSFTVDSLDTLVLNRDEQLTAILDAAGAISGYILYLPIISVSPSIVGTIARGLFRRFDSFSPYVEYIELENDIIAAETRETNGQLADRALSSLTERGLVTAKSIRAVFREEFAYVLGVFVAGAGAPEMQRDLLVNASFGVSVHVLGHVNAYCVLPTVRNARSAPAAVANGVGTVTLDTSTATNFPFLRLKTVTEGSNQLVRCSVHSYDDDGTTRYLAYRSGATAYVERSALLSDEYSLAVSDPLLYCSPEQELSLTVGNTTGSRTYAITYDGTRGLAAPYLALRDRERRVVAANTLAYSNIPVVLSMAIKYYKKSTAPTAFPVETAKTALVGFINNTARSEALKVSDIVVFLLGEYPLHLQGVYMPLTVMYTLQSPSGREIPFSTQNKISVEDMSQLLHSTAYSAAARLAEQVSDSTTRLVTFEDLVSFMEVV